MSDLTPELQRLGAALERGAAAELAAAEPSARPRRRRSRPLLLVAAALVVVIPGAAIAANQLISSDDVARSLPAGSLILVGTQPTCSVVTEGVEYHCTTARAPAPETTDAQGNPDFMGTVEPTVDATKHVNGGCRSLQKDGRVWQCYIGQAAVDQKIVGPQMLGEYAPTPGVG